MNYLKDGILEIDNNLIENSMRTPSPLDARIIFLPTHMKLLKILPYITVS